MSKFDDLALAAWQSTAGGTSEWRRATCPFCPLKLGKDDRRQSLGINAENGRYRCFRCGTSGRLEYMPEWEAQTVVKVERAEQMDPPEGFIALGEGDGLDAMSLEGPREYLRSRGLPERTWRDAGLGACLTGYFRGRIIIPVFGDDDKTWLGYVGRTWSDVEPKYLYPKGMDRGAIIYERWILDEDTDEPAIAVEGTMDALPHFGFACAFLGKPGNQHFEMICAARRPVAIALDGDAWYEAMILARRLRMRGVDAGSLRFPPKTDPNGISTAELLAGARACLGLDVPVMVGWKGRTS